MNSNIIISVYENNDQYKIFDKNATKYKLSKHPIFNNKIINDSNINDSTYWVKDIVHSRKYPSIDYFTNQIKKYKDLNTNFITIFHDKNVENIILPEDNDIHISIYKDSMYINNFCKDGIYNNRKIEDTEIMLNIVLFHTLYANKIQTSDLCNYLFSKYQLKILKGYIYELESSINSYINKAIDKIEHPDSDMTNYIKQVLFTSNDNLIPTIKKIKIYRNQCNTLQKLVDDACI